ncbi:MAG: PfkB family carbohydrate kinase [Alphaproteobacteria bacterium]
MSKGRFLQLSGVVVDLLYRVQRVPLPGQEAQVSSFDKAAGGGFNAMVAAGRSGMTVCYGGTLGQGVFADIATKAMKAEGIDILRPAAVSVDQGCCVVLVDDAGERTFIAREGAEGVVRPEDLAAVDPTGFDWILLSGYTLAYENSRDALADWLRALPDTAKLIFDPSPIVDRIPEPIREAAMAASTWISANAAEAEILCRIDDPAAACAALAKKARKGGGAVVRAGRDGCFVSTGEGPAIHVAGFAVETVDTNGAGDTHLGAFAAALYEGLPPEKAAERANAAAALSTTRHGPATAPDSNEVKAFLASRQRG